MSTKRNIPGEKKVEYYVFIIIIISRRYFVCAINDIVENVGKWVPYRMRELDSYIKVYRATTTQRNFLPPLEHYFPLKIC